jgi:hypothetical protein
LWLAVKFSTSIICVRLPFIPVDSARSTMPGLMDKFKKKKAEAAANAASEAPQEKAGGKRSYEDFVEWNNEKFVGEFEDDYYSGGFPDGYNDTNDDDFATVGGYSDAGQSYPSVGENNAGISQESDTSDTTVKSSNVHASTAAASETSKPSKGILAGLFKNKNPPAAAAKGTPPANRDVETQAELGIDSASKEKGETAPNPTNDTPPTEDRSPPMGAQAPVVTVQTSQQEKSCQQMISDSSEQTRKDALSHGGKPGGGANSSDDPQQEVAVPHFAKAQVMNDPDPAPGAAISYGNDNALFENNERVVPGIGTHPMNQDHQPSPPMLAAKIQARPPCSTERPPVLMRTASPPTTIHTNANTSCRIYPGANERANQTTLQEKTNFLPHGVSEVSDAGTQKAPTIRSGSPAQGMTAERDRGLPQESAASKTPSTPRISNRILPPSQPAAMNQQVKPMMRNAGALSRFTNKAPVSKAKYPSPDLPGLARPAASATNADSVTPATHLQHHPRSDQSTSSISPMGGMNNPDEGASNRHLQEQTMRVSPKTPKPTASVHPASCARDELMQEANPHSPLASNGGATTPASQNVPLGSTVTHLDSSSASLVAHVTPGPGTIQKKQVSLESNTPVAPMLADTEDSLSAFHDTSAEETSGELRSDEPPSEVSFEELQSLFQNYMQDLNDQVEEHDSALLDMQTLFWTAYAETMQNQADLVAFLARIEEHDAYMDDLIRHYQEILDEPLPELPDWSEGNP